MTILKIGCVYERFAKTGGRALQKRLKI